MPLPRREPYPHLEPHRTYRLRVSARHELHVEESGNPRGVPVVCLHGGPGAGLDPTERRLFDPTAYRILHFDQRGCGRSTPFASTEENTTWDLVADLERLRETVGVARWHVFGGSWGATLALAYAQAHPSRVTALILRGVFLLRQEELDWFYRAGADRLFPDCWEDFVAPIPPSERDDLLAAYHRRLQSTDPAICEEAAHAWTTWELATCSLATDEALLARAASYPDYALALARLETHYFVHRAWLQGKDLLGRLARIRRIPAEIIQGRYDVVCPLRSAWDLHRAWPEARFHLVEGAGHAAGEAGIEGALLEATDRQRASGSNS